MEVLVEEETNTMTMLGGEIISTAGIGLEVSRNTTIKGGKIKALNSDGIRISYYGPLTIERNDNGDDLVIEAKDGINITYSSGVVNMNAGTINAENSGITMSDGRFNMNGGIINASNGVNVTSSSTYANIIDGTINATNIGIISDWAEVTLGANDGTINSTPLITAKKAVVNNNNSKFYFYDGILRGTEKAVEGNYKGLADNTLIRKEDVIIEDVSYEQYTLEEQENFLSVNGVEYNSLKKAVDAIETTGTIELITSSTTATETTIPVNKTITIDMAGYTLNLNSSLINNGDLIVMDSSENKSGSFVFKNNNTILENAKNLTIKSGKIENLVGEAITNKSKLIIEDGILQGATYGVQNQGTVNLKNGIINGATAGVGNGTLNMEDGLITGGTGVQRGKIIMSGGTIHATSVGILNTSETNITGGTIISDNDYGIKIEGSTWTSDYYHFISNVIIQSKRSGIEIGHYANLYYIYKANANIENVTINSASTGIDVISSSIVSITNSNINGATGVYSEGKTTIIGGKISGVNYGIHSREYHYGKGIINLGSMNDDYFMVPEIIGDKYGAYKESGTINFYDGVIKGITEPIFGKYDALVSNMTIKETVETIDEKVYTVNSLDEQINFISNNDNIYNNLQTAIDEAANGDTLDIINDAFIFDSINIDVSKNVSIDLNGHNLSFSSTISNNDDLVIKNSNSKKSKMYSTRSEKLIINNKSLEINNIIIDDTVLKTSPLTNSKDALFKIKNCDFVVDKVVDNVGELLIENSDIEASVNNYAINNSGVASILNTNINSIGSYYSIYSSGPLSVLGGTFVGKSNYNLIYVNAPSATDITIESATIGSETTRGNIFVNSGTVKNMKNNNIFGNIELREGVTNAHLVGNNITMAPTLNRSGFVAVNALTNLTGSNNTINIDATGVNYNQTGIVVTGNMELTNTEVNIIGGSVSCAIKTSVQKKRVL